MREVFLELIQAVKSGDLKSLQLTLDDLSDLERRSLLSERAQASAFVKRPSGESEMQIWNPNLLMLAVTGWYPAVVEYLAAIKLFVDEEHTLDDPISTPRMRTGVTALHVAAITGKHRALQVLLENGAAVNHRAWGGETALYEACFEGQQTIVEELLAHGADVTVTSQKQVTCLMIAAFADHPEVVKLLLEKQCGVDLTAVDYEGRNVLFYGVAAGKVDTLAYLLDSGAEVATDQHGVTLLMEAAHHGHADTLQYLLRYSALLQLHPRSRDDVGRNVLFYAMEQPNITCLQLLLHDKLPLEPMYDGRTVLMAAALSSCASVVHHLVSRAGELHIDINQKDNKGRNCLFYCITGGSLELFDYLASQGVRVEPSEEGVTLLMQAVAKNRPDFVTYLLDTANKCDLDINAEDADGWNAAFYAVASGFMHLFVQLTNRGVDCRHTNDNRSVLMQAAFKGNLELVCYIVDRASKFSVYVNQRDNDGWNALFYAVQGGHLDMFSYLLQRGAKVCVALNGVTLLMEAVDKNQLDFVKYLLDSRERLEIDLNHKDNEGNNALVYAVVNGNYAIFQTLLNEGCEISNDLHGRTLLMQAALHGHIELVRHLVNFSESLSIDIHQGDSDGRNVLFYCIENGHQDVLEYLVLCGVKPEPDNCGRTNIMQACRSGYLSIVRYLLENPHKVDVDLNSVDKSGENALFYAARHPSTELHQYLLEQGVAVTCNKHGISILSQSLHDRKLTLTQNIIKLGHNLQESVRGKDLSGRTALHHFVMMGDLNTLTSLSCHYSASHDHDADGCTLLMHSCARRGLHQLNITRFLVETLHVDVHTKDLCSRNALMHAVIANNMDTVQYLLEHTAIRQESDQDGAGAVMLASASGNINITEALLQKGSKDLPNRLDNAGRNALHYCAMQGKHACLNLLKAYGCDIRVRDEQGRSVLMYAVCSGHGYMVTALLKRAADVNARDTHERTALHHCFASDTPSARCVKELLRFGVDVNQQDRDGVTALMLAANSCAKTDINIIRLLLESGAEASLQDSQGRDAFDYCAFDAEYVKALMRQKTEMAARDKDTLLKHKSELAAILDINSVLRSLVKDKVFTKTLSFEVIKNTPSERVQKLVEILFFRGPCAFNAFCNILKKEGHLELAYTLLRDAYAKEDEIFW